MAVKKKVQIAVKKKLNRTMDASYEPILSMYVDANHRSSMVENKYEITFRVYKDRDGVFCASSSDRRVYTFGKTMNSLWNHIKDAIECYYEIPSSNFIINLRMETEDGNVETITDQTS